MDMLGKQWMREIILEQYQVLIQHYYYYWLSHYLFLICLQSSSEPETIKLAIHKARINDIGSNFTNISIFEDYTGEGMYVIY